MTETEIRENGDKSGHESALAAMHQAKFTPPPAAQLQTMLFETLKVKYRSHF